MESLGDLLKGIQRNVQAAKKRSGKAAQAQALLRAKYPDWAGQVSVASVKTGVVTLETSSAALFQELEGFHRDEVLAALRESGLQVSAVRARLKG
jgi:hypothetical protein